MIYWWPVNSKEGLSLLWYGDALPPVGHSGRGEAWDVWWWWWFLAGSSFPRPCLLLGDLGPRLDAAARELGSSPGTDPGGAGAPGTLDLFLLPSSIQAGVSLPQTPATQIPFTERKVVHKMKWKLAIQYGWDMFSFTYMRLILTTSAYFWFSSVELKSGSYSV